MTVPVQCHRTGIQVGLPVLRYKEDRSRVIRGRPSIAWCERNGGSAWCARNGGSAWCARNGGSVSFDPQILNMCFSANEPYDGKQTTSVCVEHH